MDIVVRNRAELTAAGRSLSWIRDSVSTGRLERVRRGRYVDGPAWNLLSRSARHALLVEDLWAGGGAVVSHLSAAVLLGLTIPGDADLRRVHLTWPGSAGRAPTPNLIPHRAVGDPGDVTQVRGNGRDSGNGRGSGIDVTNVVRTVYDLALYEDQLLSVAVADAALLEGRCEREEFTAVLDRMIGRQGRALAVQVLAFADPRATSVMQSQARVLMARAGLPPPDLAVTVDHPRGWQMGPFHFGFAGARTVAVVADGSFPGQLDRAGVEESLRWAGLSIAWIESADLAGVEQLDRRIASAFALSGSRHHHRRAARLRPGRADSISADSLLTTRYPG